MKKADSTVISDEDYELDEVLVELNQGPSSKKPKVRDSPRKRETVVSLTAKVATYARITTTWTVLEDEDSTKRPKPLAEFRKKYFGSVELPLSYEEAWKWLEENAHPDGKPSSHYVFLQKGKPAYTLSQGSAAHDDLLAAAKALCLAPDGTAEPGEGYRWRLPEAMGHILTDYTPQVESIETDVVQDFFAPCLPAIVLHASPNADPEEVAKAFREAAALILGRFSEGDRKSLSDRIHARRILLEYEDQPKDSPRKEELLNELGEHFRENSEPRTDSVVETTDRQFSDWQKLLTSRWPRSKSDRAQMLAWFLSRTPTKRRLERYRMWNQIAPQAYRFKRINSFDVAVKRLNETNWILPSSDDPRRSTRQPRNVEPWWTRGQSPIQTMNEVNQGRRPPKTRRLRLKSPED